MLLAEQFGSGQVFLSMLEFFLFFIWIWLLVIVFGDIFRSQDLGGGAKALWTIFVIVLPYFGVFIYILVRGHRMHERAEASAQQQEAATRAYIKSVASSNGGEASDGGAASELQRLAELRDRGVLDETEFQAAKAKVLA